MARPKYKDNEATAVERIEEAYWRLQAAKIFSDEDWISAMKADFEASM